MGAAPTRLWFHSSHSVSPLLPPHQDALSFLKHQKYKSSLCTYVRPCTCVHLGTNTMHGSVCSA